MVDFFLRINESREAALHLKPASEACFSWSAHVATVSSRVQRLASIEHPEAGRFARRLASVWTGIDERLRALAFEDSELRADERCLSPSDFGFHNALIVDDDLVWLDFEYAGWDDPAKLVCDAVCQPALALPAKAWDVFLEMLDVRFGGVARRRAELLLPAYQIKWCCILLNEFRPTAQARREFAGHKLSEQRLKEQLEKAESLLGRIL